jgi:lysine 2,3-aminomutase
MTQPSTKRGGPPYQKVATTSRFAPAPRPEVDARDWESWAWQHQKRIRTLEQLERVIEVTDGERAAFEASHELFEMAITPYYASLMDPKDPSCPIRLQCVPQPGELTVQPYELEDPLAEEAHMPVPGVTHRYPDRALLYTTHTCPVYCRHCTRKRKVSDPSTSASLQQLERGLEYIASRPEIRDVLVSGGDPLSNSDARLELILSRLRAIPHVELIRLCTRNPVTLPQRITEELARMLSRYHPIYVHTHFNHPKECTREAFEACARLADAGCALNNQMVLLKGVNDDAETVRELNHRLLQMRVRPYYIFQADMAQGISHFRTPIEKGLEIIDKLRGWTSGLAVPHFVVDLPGGGGKVAMVPDHVLGRDGSQWTLRNYQNRVFTYTDC